MSVRLLGGIPGTSHPDGNNVIDVCEGFQKAVEHVRLGKGPVLIESVIIVGFRQHLLIRPSDTEEVGRVEEEPIETSQVLEIEIASAEELDLVSKRRVEAS